MLDLNLKWQMSTNLGKRGVNHVAGGRGSVDARYMEWVSSGNNWTGGTTMIFVDH